MEKVVVFIDGSNVLFSAINSGISPAFDYSKLVKKLVGDRKLVRAYFYDAPLKQNDEPERYKKQQSFLEHLRMTEYFELRLGRLVAQTKNGVTSQHQKGVDVKIAVDMMDFGSNGSYDTAILMSGDSDLVSAVEYVKRIGRHVELAFFDKCYELKKASDKFTPLTKELFADCQRDPKNLSAKGPAKILKPAKI